MRIFLDTEFTNFEEPELLSIGLVASVGTECYVELVNDRLRTRCNAFVREHVLSQFGRFPDARARDLADLAARIGAFLFQFEEPLEVCYDSGFDKSLLIDALRASPTTADLTARLQWLNVSIETCVPEAQDVLEAFFAESAYALDLHQHHALVDARALKAAFAAYENR